MRRSIIPSTLVIGAVALGVAACGGSDDTPATSTGIVSVADVGGTRVLADAAGKTLYSAAVEKGGTIRCVDACTSFWDPVLASPADATKAAKQLDADLGLVRRPDGKRQLTLDGLPLYTFAQEGARKLEGDGFVDDFQGTHFEWEAARTGGDSGSSAPSQNRGGGGGYGY